MGVKIRRVSSFYETEPVEVCEQPWFINCVAEVETNLMPLELLGALKSLERQLGRQPGIPKGPRPIDMDILLYENVVVRTPELNIPHPKLAERRFVLVPLSELAADVRDPASGRKVGELLRETKDTSQVVRIRDG